MGTRGVIALLCWGGAAVVFAICSAVQAAGHSDMFSTRYQDPGNFLLDIAMNVTFYPGWGLTVLLVFYGFVALVKTDN